MLTIKNINYSKYMNAILISLNFLKEKIKKESNYLDGYLNDDILNECLNEDIVAECRSEQMKKIREIEDLENRINSSLVKLCDHEPEKIFKFPDQKLLMLAILKKYEQLKNFSDILSNDNLTPQNKKLVEEIEKRKNNFFSQTVSFMCGQIKMTQEEIELDIQQYKRDNNLN